MLARACNILGISVLGISAILIAAPVWGQGGRYDPNYPVCMEVPDTGGTRIECFYTSYEQCRQVTFGQAGTCFNNPYYVARPAEAAPAETEPAPATKPKKSAGRYDPDYPVCMEAYDTSGPRIECFYMAMEPCQEAARGAAGTCFKNPFYVPPPPEPTSAQTEPAPTAKPAKPVKSAKSAKSTQSPPSPQPAQSR